MANKRNKRTLDSFSTEKECWRDLVSCFYKIEFIITTSSKEYLNLGNFKHEDSNEDDNQQRILQFITCILYVLLHVS